MSRSFLCRITILLAVVTVAGCGIPADDGPVALDSAKLPPESVPAEAQDDAADADADAAVLYLVAGGALQPVSRPVPPTVAAAVRALLKGPRDTETALGLRTAIPAGTRLLGTSVVGETIRLDLSEEFTSVEGAEHLLALAQLVYTATESSPLAGVAISIEGDPVAVAAEDGHLVTRPVVRDDYRSIAEPAAP